MLRLARRASAAPLALATACALVAVLAHAPCCQAQDDPDEPVIAAGRERDVLALFRPFTPGQPIDDEWRVGNVAVRQTAIDVHIISRTDQRATLRLENVTRAARADERSASFRIMRSGDASARTALDRIVRALRTNDRGGFWPAAGDPRPGRHGGAVTTRAALAHWLARFARTYVDGIAVTVLLLALLAAVARSQLRAMPRNVGVALAAVIVVGLALRLALSQRLPMTAWSYTRVVPLASRIFDGPLLALFGRTTGLTFSLAGTIFSTNLIVAALTPLTIFCHATYLFRDWRSSLLAAALVATSPMHIRFSQSDVYEISSLATSSMTFVALYTAITSPSRLLRGFAFLILPALCTATYFVRPENMVFYPLDLAGIVVVTGQEHSRTRKFVAASIVTATAALAFAANLLVSYGNNMRDGLSLSTLRSAVELLLRPDRTAIFNPTISPTLVLVAAILGARELWRTNQRRKTVFLVGWWVGFFTVNSYVVPPEPAMQARYHLNVLTPTILLASACVPVVLRRATHSWRIALVVYLAATPLLHIRFVRAAAFYEMQEFQFLREALSRVPDDCLVVEHTTFNDVGFDVVDSGMHIGRFSTVLRRGVRAQRWLLLRAAIPSGDRMLGRDDYVRNPDLRTRLRAAHCAYFVQGISCHSERRSADALAPPCAALLASMPHEIVMQTNAIGRTYDHAMSGYYLSDGPGRSRFVQGFENGARLQFALHRLSRSAEEPRQRP